jgi:hypothetical protein
VRWLIWGRRRGRRWECELQGESVGRLTVVVVPLVEALVEGGPLVAQEAGVPAHLSERRSVRWIDISRLFNQRKGPQPPTPHLIRLTRFNPLDSTHPLTPFTHPPTWEASEKGASGKMCSRMWKASWWNHMGDHTGRPVSIAPSDMNTERPLCPCGVMPLGWLDWWVLVGLWKVEDRRVRVASIASKDRTANQYNPPLAQANKAPPLPPMTITGRAPFLLLFLPSSYPHVSM